MGVIGYIYLRIVEAAFKDWIQSFSGGFCIFIIFIRKSSEYERDSGKNKIGEVITLPENNVNSEESNFQTYLPRNVCVRVLKEIEGRRTNWIHNFLARRLAYMRKYQLFEEGLYHTEYYISFFRKITDSVHLRCSLSMTIIEIICQLAN